jgi:hypothetical protein
VVTDLDEMLTAFSGDSSEDDTIRVLKDYLTAGGILLLCTDSPFDWLYVGYCGRSHRARREQRICCLSSC